MTDVDRSALRTAMAAWLEMVGHTATIAAVAVADQLGLFPLLLESVTAEELALHNGWNERHLEELLFALTAGGLVDHANGRFQLSEAHAALVSDPTSPYFMAGQARVLADAMGRAGQVAAVIVEGGGIDPNTYSRETVLALERMNGPSQAVLLPRKWIAALPDVVERLDMGAVAADVGCGAGVATEALARRFPNTTFVGYDASEAAIQRADGRAAEAELENLSFEHRSLHDMPNTTFDFVLAYDVIHDLPDPERGLVSIRRSLLDDGVVLLVEPNAAADVDDNRHSMGALLYGMSALHCVPVGLHDGGEGVGACWGPERIERYVREAGYAGFTPLPIENIANAFYRLDR